MHVYLVWHWTAFVNWVSITNSNLLIILLLRVLLALFNWILLDLYLRHLTLIETLGSVVVLILSVLRNCFFHPDLLLLFITGIHYWWHITLNSQLYRLAIGHWGLLGIGIKLAWCGIVDISDSHRLILSYLHFPVRILILTIYGGINITLSGYLLTWFVIL